jgi:DNA mismatch repair protein PMS2
VLSKGDFASMRVVGQFNLGFIIAELRGDLYILDQHACDEKYTFERLQRETAIHQQPLITPLTVDCSPAEEMTILDNLAVFERNGFKFLPLGAEGEGEGEGEERSSSSGSSSGSGGDTVSQDTVTSSAGRRLRLAAVPFSKSVQFGIADIHELASIVGEGVYGGFGDGAGGGADTGTGSYPRAYAKNALLSSSGGGSGNSSSSSSSSGSGDGGENEGSSSSSSSTKMMPVLPKLMTMFASRACRSSVMIGTALKRADMSGIVRRLEGIEQPWNCPHGRPTMRHLADLVALSQRTTTSSSSSSSGSGSGSMSF